ncbi:MAG: 2-isopropylmalate synthase [Myxococcales bacterium]|nr:2-isopropylmalate synthase [Myxococcales bacterium]
MSEKVIVFDTTLRDGEQSAGVAFDQRDKLEIAERLAALRVDVIEAGFPAASTREVDAVRAVARQVREASICALARAVPGDVDAAAQALRGAAAPRIHVFVNSSDMHLAHQLRRGRDEVIGIARAMVARASDAVGDVEFSPMDATRADPAFLAELVDAAVAAGARTINIPDTVGYIMPHQLAAMLDQLRERSRELHRAVLSFHGQDDLGLASANALTAVRHGARQVELTINGIGERAGNTSLEEVVMALRVHGSELGVHTGVRTEGITELSRQVERRSGMAVQPNKAVVGRNAFRHASGIHQDGVLKHRATYEVMDPSWVGNAEGTQIVLGKLSGRAGFAARAEALGYPLRGARLQRAFERFQTLADTSSTIDDATVTQICQAIS